MKKYFIKESDVGKFSTVIKCACCESKEVIVFSGCLGRVLKCDVGKMMVKNGDVWQVENESQFNKRIGKQ
jgi:hypothetical protein